MSKLKVMAVASQGGHLVQLMRIRPLFDKYNTVYISNVESFNGIPVEKVLDANFDQKVRLFLLSIQILIKVLIYRPNVVITTGAAPGFFAVLWGRLIGAKTIWIDSIANAEELSMAGKKVKRISSVCLSQWEDVAAKEGVEYIGNIL